MRLGGDTLDTTLFILFAAIFVGGIAYALGGWVAMILGGLLGGALALHRVVGGKA